MSAPLARRPRGLADPSERGHCPPRLAPNPSPELLRVLEMVDSLAASAAGRKILRDVLDAHKSGVLH